MSKLCEKCGAELNDTDKVCPKCGAAVAEKATKKDVNNDSVTKTEKDNKKTIAIVGGISAGIIVILIVIFSLISNAYKKPIDNYFKGIQKESSKVFVKAYPPFMKEKIEKDYDDSRLSKMVTSYEKEYGDNIKISYKVLDKTKMDKEDIKKVQENLQDSYKDQKIKVTDGYKVCVKGTIKGKEDKETDYSTMKVYKINGGWYFVR